MDVNEVNITAMVGYLRQTLSHDANIRRPAEQFLQSVERNRNYALLLLHVIDQDNIELIVRIAGAIAFKNFVKRNWEEDELIDENDRLAIKENIIGIMLRREDQIQRQLSDAVSIIGEQDFPEKWPRLLDELIERIQSSGGNFAIINGILQTCNSLFRRFRHEFKSQELWMVIKTVLNKFAKPFTELFVATVDLAAANATNPEALKIIFSSLVLCCKIFYSLNAQDLPEFFEDNINIWMPKFLDLLKIDIQLLRTTDTDEAGLLEQLKSQICDNISMYAQKYQAEFAPFLSEFVDCVWQLLVNTGNEPKYDLLVSNAIKFLSTVAMRPQFQKLFENPEVLKSLCSRVIIPNVEFRTSDEELFEDNPEEFIRMDIEGSDVDTRRRAACDFIKSLAKFIETQIIETFSAYIQELLQNYAQNPQQFWRSKDAAIYIVTAMSVKGATARHGVTKASKLVDVIEFYNNFIKPDLQRTDNLNDFAVLRADALKYIVTFRNQLSLEEVILPTLPSIIAHLSAPSVVVHTYAAHCLERLFTVQQLGQARQSIVQPQHIEQFIQPLITALFNVMAMEGSSENEYAMRALTKTLFLSQERVYPLLEEIVKRLAVKLTEISKNPLKPNFNHYLFESIALCITIGHSCNKQSIIMVENYLFPIFQAIILQDIQEFVPYVFQILSFLVEKRAPEDSLPDFYTQLLPGLITPTLWERAGNMDAPARLLQALITRQPAAIVTSGKLQGILGVFQKLISSKANDHIGFNLLNAIIESIPAADLQNYIKAIFLLLFTRLSNSKTPKFVNKLLVFFSLFAYRYGAAALESMINQIQANMFTMVLERIFIAETTNCCMSDVDKKLVAVGIIKIFIDIPSLISNEEQKALAINLLQNLVILIEPNQNGQQVEQEQVLDDEDVAEYQAAYSKLQYAILNRTDPFGGQIADIRLFLVQSLVAISPNYPGRLTQLISGCDPKVQELIQKYLTNANVRLD